MKFYLRLVLYISIVCIAGFWANSVNAGRAKLLEEIAEAVGKAARSGAGREAEEGVIKKLSGSEVKSIHTAPHPSEQPQPIKQEPPHTTPAVADDFRYTNNSESKAALQAVKAEPVKLVDIHGNILSSQNDLALQKYEESAAQLLKYIIRQENIHGKISETDLEKLLIDNLKKALNDKKSGPFSKFKYSFDLASGKVKLTLPRQKGEITAEFNAYSMTLQFSQTLVAGSGWYYAHMLGKEKSENEDKTSKQPNTSQKGH